MTLIQKATLLASRCIDRFWRLPLNTVLAHMMLKAWGASVGSKLAVRGRLRLHLRGILHIGSNVRLNSGAHNYVGIGHRVSIWIGPKGNLAIGHGCAISNSTIVCMEGIEIKPETFIGGGCGIYDTDFHQLEPEKRVSDEGHVSTKPIQIGPKAFVGASCMILKGVNIGEGAVIGAGSVVTKSIPPRQIWAGNPARFIRSLDPVA